MEKLPPCITAPLNNVMDCFPVSRESEHDGPVDSDEDEAGNSPSHGYFFFQS